MIWHKEEHLDGAETQDVQQEEPLRLYTTRRYLHEWIDSLVMEGTS